MIPDESTVWFGTHPPGIEPSHPMHCPPESLDQEDRAGDGWVWFTWNRDKEAACISSIFTVHVFTFRGRRTTSMPPSRGSRMQPRRATGSRTRSATIQNVVVYWFPIVLFNSLKPVHFKMTKSWILSIELFKSYLVTHWLAK